MIESSDKVSELCISTVIIHSIYIFLRQKRATRTRGLSRGLFDGGAAGTRRANQVSAAGAARQEERRVGCRRREALRRAGRRRAPAVPLGRPALDLSRHRRDASARRSSLRRLLRHIRSAQERARTAER